MKTLSRRDFLKVSVLAGGGFAVGTLLPGCIKINDAPKKQATADSGKAFEPNAWVRITPDNAVTLVVDKSEMGQGVWTAMPMLIAEELDADWARLKFVPAPANAAYKNPKLGIQATGGSTSVAASYEPLRKVGAAARAMLVSAAAKQWNVDAATLTTENGVVRDPKGNRQATYGELANAAAQIPVPQNPQLKTPDKFRLIGKPVPRTDTPSKVDGTAQFGIDVKLPGMLIATVVHSPVFGGKVAQVDDSAAKQVPGFKAVVPVENGVAVVATDFWSAKKGVDALKIQWNEGDLANLSSASIQQLYADEAAKGQAVPVQTLGNVDQALAGATTKVDAVYQVPYAAHATMEPMNCTVYLHDGVCEVWVGTQMQTGIQMTASKLSGVPQDKVIVNTTMLGGGFGRRFEQDFVAEAVTIAKAMKAPVKLIWTREEDMTHDFYRPAVYNALTGTIGQDGMPIAWKHRLVTSSIMGRLMPQMVKNGVDPSSVEGASELPYAIPNVTVDYVHKETGVPVGFWRSVGNSHTAFVKESFLDELANAAQQDPLEYRRKLLANPSRELGVLNLAAEKAGWGTPMPQGQGRGIAVHKSFGSYSAQVAEVTVDGNNGIRVNRIVCAFDCGTVVNPDTVKAQAESAVVFALTAALKGPITIDKGRVQQTNFNTYPMLRLNEMPIVEVYLVPSTEPPSGVGEPNVPPVAPAVANAIFVATGKRVRNLPLVVA